jgi:hypothetical protein
MLIDIQKKTRGNPEILRASQTVNLAKAHAHEHHFICIFRNFNQPGCAKR